MANEDFVCVLRASCRRKGLGALLRAYPRCKPDAVWKAGVARFAGRVTKTNGFNLCVGEGSDWPSVAALIRRRLRSLAPMIRDGQKIGAKFELDVGVFLGRSQYWDRSARFTTKDLVPVVDLGVTLCVSAYPPSIPSAGQPRRARAKARRRVAS